MQLRVLRLGLLQNEDVGIGVFPESEEVLIGFARTFLVSTHRFGTSQLQVRERSQRKVQDDAAVIEELLELGGGLLALARLLVRLTAHLGWIDGAEVLEGQRFS